MNNINIIQKEDDLKKNNNLQKKENKHISPNNPHTRSNKKRIKR